MNESTCCVAECERVARTRGMCNAHYQRFRRTGEMPTTPLRTHIYGRGCDVEGCDRPHHSGGYCQLHGRRLEQFGDVHRSKIMPRGERHWKWGGAEVDYKAVHKRIYTRRGAASDHQCVNCGSAARHWAYDHTDPDELTCPEGWVYSLDPDRYQPMCPLCHKAMDGAYRRAAARVGQTLAENRLDADHLIA